jgi:putative PIG3 family NAD(P)H quinone oxidoreductase
VPSRIKDKEHAMKAVLLDGFGGPEVMRLGTVDTPVPADDQVLVKVMATSVNRADLIQRQGHYPPPKGESEILGLEAAGVVARTGAGVKDWKIGDRVMSLLAGGGYAQYVAVYGDHLMPIPETLSFEEAAGVSEVYITAFLNVILIGGYREDETVLLHGGGGGVNTAAIQLCRCLVPDGRIIVTASPAKLDRVKALGADRVVSYRTEDFVAAVRDFTENRGADVILDHIGAQYLAANLSALAIEGRLVIIGLMGGSTAEINLGHLMVKRQRIIGSVLRARSVEAKTAIVRTFRERVMPLFADRWIAPLIHRVYPIDAVQDAHKEMEASRHFGKIILSLV